MSRNESERFRRFAARVFSACMNVIAEERPDRKLNLFFLSSGPNAHEMRRRECGYGCGMAGVRSDTHEAQLRRSPVVEVL